MMKAFRIILLFLLMLPFTACEDFFGDINVDPDNPTEVTPTVLLPQIEARLAYTIGGDGSRFAGLMTQHIDGVGRQFVVFQNYGISGSDMDAMWSNLYSGILMDNRQLLALAEAGGLNHFIGVSKAIEAYTWLFLASNWGDVPFSEALQGTAVLQPSFDSQRDIYTGIHSLLDEARAALSLDDGGFPVGSADLIYGGDAGQWIKFCNVTEARARLHLSKVDGAAAYTAALAALDKGSFESRADDARFTFGSASTENAPWFQYLAQRTDTQVGDSYVALMQSLGDPRAATYGYPHSAEGDHPVLVANRAFPLLTYTEAEFIRAECLANGSGDPAEALLNAVTSSFSDAGVDPSLASGYVAGLGAPSATIVATQKYIAMFNDPEAWNDWKRTGIPSLTPNTGSEIPRRFPWAETEQLSNTNTPSNLLDQIYDRNWWDQ